MNNDLNKLREENLRLKKELERLKQFQENKRHGMEKKASQGNLMSRPAFGYTLDSDGKLIPAQNSEEIREIFEEFLNEKISLRQLSQKHNFSVNGLKKILTNFTYIGKVKFGGLVHDGKHTPIISSTLFNKVQDKFEKLGIEK